MALSDGYEGSRGRDILLGVVIGALLLSVAWLASWSVSSQDATANPPRGAGAALAGREPTRDERSSSPCREVFVAQTAPLRAAEPALSQWQVHIGAMNQLIAGTITLERAQRFWDQTRVGALRRLERYDRARARYGQRTVRCPQPADSSDSSESRACTKAVGARARALRAAAVTLGTWQVHVHHMDMLRAGEMTPEEATRLWLASWRQGDRELEAYSRAAQATRGERC